MAFKIELSLLLEGDDELIVLHPLKGGADDSDDEVYHHDIHEESEEEPNGPDEEYV